MAPTQLDDFQLQTVAFMEAANGRVLYADPMGARKTGTILSWLEKRQDLGLTLVVAPGAVHGHWAREAKRFLPDVPVLLWKGSPATRVELASNLPRVGLVIVTYSLTVNDIDLLERAQFDTVVYDEGHRLKGRTTNVAVAANRLAKAKHLILATGTPVLNHPHELWQYLHMLRPRDYTSFWRWAGEHFFIEQKVFKGQRKPTRLIHGFRPGHEDIVRNDLMGIMVQRELHELFDVDEHPWIVEPDHVEVPVTLSPAERKLYNKLVESAWGKTLTGKLINTGNSAVLTTRLRQLSSDWGNLDADLPTGSKLVATRELAAELSRREPVIVFAQFKSTVNHLVEMLNGLGVRARAYTGDNASEHEPILADYADGKVDVIAGTIASMGEGVDGLQYRSSQVIMIDRDWRALINDQAIGRSRRSGQHKRVTVWHVFAEDTIDESVHETNLRKENFDRVLKGKRLTDVLYGRMGTIVRSDEVEIEVV